MQREDKIQIFIWYGNMNQTKSSLSVFYVYQVYNKT